MKKYLIASIALLAVVSCAKEAQAPVQNVEGGKLITISATIPTDGITKVDLAEDGGYTGGLKLTWAAGDKITVTETGNPANSQEFTLSAGEGTAAGIFTGPELAAATSYKIVYNGFGSSFDYTEQTQATDGSTDHLKYGATLSGVSSYEDFEFSETWATSKGGTFASTSVLRLRMDIPMNLEDVQAVYIKSDPLTVFGAIKVNITTPADEEESDILTVYASLPFSTDITIPAGTGLVVQFQMSDKDYDKYTAYRTLSAMKLKSGKVNSLALDFNTDQNITLYANKVLDDIGTSSNPYLIGDQHQMALMASEMVSGSTIYFKIVDDIDMTGVDWIPLNYASPYEKGINFDGGDHIISNLTVDTSHMDGSDEVAHGYPSFAGVAYGVYKNVTFDKAVIDAGSNNTGVFAGYIGTGTGEIYADCRGITISNSSVTATAATKERNAGGFAGLVGNASSYIKDCHVTGNTTISQTQTTAYNGCNAGGFIGNIKFAATIEDCTASANLSNKNSYYTGGFAGQINDAATISNCAFLGGTLTAERSNDNSPVAGFVGYVPNVAATITDCYVTGAIINASVCGRSAGFAGQIGNGSTLTSCYVENSSVSAGLNSGGFAGVFYNSSVNKCYVTGTTVTANANQTAGFIAYPQNSTVTNCFVASSVTVTGGTYSDVGGFYGRLNNGVSTSQCYEAATVSGTSESTGAFIGNVQAVPTSITKCVAWDASLLFWANKKSGLEDEDINAVITGNYIGTSGSISAQATTLGWDTSIWDLSGDVPVLK